MIMQQTESGEQVDKERTRAEARAVAILNRPAFSPWLTLFSMAAAAAVMYLMQQAIPEPARSQMMLGFLGMGIAAIAADSWVDRQRLNAAIMLLKLRDGVR